MNRILDLDSPLKDQTDVLHAIGAIGITVMRVPKPLTVPCVTLNGTTARNLVDDYCNAAGCLELALDALAKCSPNGRDYPLAGTLKTAEGEHNARRQKIKDVIKELRVLSENVSDQNDPRG